MTSDELVGWARGMNQYRAGRGGDREFFLQAWSGTPILKNRAAPGAVMNVPSPFLCVLGSLPPDLLHTLADPHEREDGFLQRFLFTYPEPVAGSWTDRTVAPRVEQAWEETIQRLWQLLPEAATTGAGAPKAVVLRLTPEATRAFVRF